MTVGDAKFHLKRLLHGAKESSIGDIDYLFERASNTMLTKIDPITTMRVAPLSNLIHDDVYNYALPSDFKKPIDLFPQDNRNDTDYSQRRFAEDFDLEKMLESKQISVESNDGSKYFRINWRSRQGQVLHTMESLTDNGTWSVVATASGLKATEVYKVSGNASIEFDVAVTGDGIQNTTITSLDMTDEDEVADVFTWVYLGSTSSLTSITARWGNDLTTNYWTSTAQTTQADGTAFKVGWNLIKFSWATATETGTVDPTVIDSFRITFTVTSAIANIRVDNILFSIGRNFDLKYYSKYILKNSSGTWINRTTSDNDTIVLDNDEVQIFLLECLNTAGQQIESDNSKFDISWAKLELQALYDRYREEHPSQSKKPKSVYYKLRR